jgi:hypothetical protein
MAWYEGTTSEVGRILAQIQAEYQSGMLGLSGLASGTARHDFITTRMEQMGRLHNELRELVGEESAIAMVVHTLEQGIEDAPSS